MEGDNDTDGSGKMDCGHADQEGPNLSDTPPLNPPRFENPGSVMCWANGGNSAIIHALQELEIVMPEPQEVSEDEEEPYINIFQKWYLSRGENNPRGGLTALLSQHSDLNHDQIREILKGQQATELLFEAIFTGIGHEKQGIDFFQILNPPVIVSKGREECQNCGVPADRKVELPESLGTWDLVMETRAPAYESVQSLMTKFLFREFDAPCAQCNVQGSEEGAHILRTESTKLADGSARGFVVSLCRKIHSTKRVRAAFLDREIELNYELMIPQFTGPDLKFELIATVQHVDYLQTGGRSGSVVTVVEIQNVLGQTQ